jgi:hypothetical protein
MPGLNMPSCFLAGRSSRDEEHLQHRVPQQQDVGELLAVHLRHDDVGDEDVEGPYCLLDDVQRLGAAGGRNHLIPLPAQRVGGKVAHDELVFHE